MTSISASSIQRLGPIADLPRLLHRFGREIADVTYSLPLTEADFRPGSFLPLGTVSEILDRAVAITGCEIIGLELGRGHDHRVLGVLGELMSCCDTLGSALGTFVNLQIANSTAAAAYLHPLGEDYAFGFGVYAPGVVSSQFYDVCAAVACNLVSSLTGGSVVPLEIIMSRPAPPHLEPYRGILRCPLRFDESHSCMILPGRAMRHRLVTANPVRRAQATEQIQQKLARQPLSATDRVRHALRSMLFAGTPALTSVARYIGVHPRTLERQLQRESTTFEALREQVRMAVAQELLARTALNVSDVAAALGYGSLTVFGRAFRRKNGQSPSHWRHALTYQR